MNQPRLPTKQELDQLTIYWVQKGYELEEAKAIAATSYIAVFDNYVSCSPGYTGKVMLVLWDGGPSQYMVYTWDNDGVLRPTPQELS